MFRLVVGIAIFVVCTVSAFAVCSAPAQSGLALCFPSVGSTVLYPATIELGVNSGGVPITHLAVYDGNTKVDDLGFLPGQLVDFSLANGLHHITVNAWDANGKLYQAKSSFTITGFGVTPCPRGSGAINLCWPVAGTSVPSASAVSAAFGTGVTNWSMMLDGKLYLSSAQLGQSASSPIMSSYSAPAGTHTLVVKAVDSKGVTSSVTRQFSTFYDLDCGPKGGACTPGIAILQPSNVSEDLAGDVGLSFQVQAEVMYNAKPTTKMVVYLDGVKKEQSAGPGITVNLTAPQGSHYLVIQAWDTAGKLYETYGNVNVQAVNVQ